MKENYENLLERHCIIEEKVGQLEEQLEISAEALEKIFMHLKYFLNDFFTYSFN